jgi:glycosyltransferase involved in cell wall biosynthesis
MKRVLFVLPAIEPSWATNQARLLLPHLLAAGYDVHACALAARAEFCLGPQVPYTPIAGRGPLDPLAWLELRRHIGRLAPQIVHAWLPTYEPRLRLLPLADRRVPWLISQSGFQKGDGSRFLKRLPSPFNVPPFNVPLNVWTLSHPGAYARALAEGLPGAKVHLIASGLEPAAEPTQSRAQWLERLGLPPGARVMGAVGRLQTQGRWKDLIWAADMLKFVRDDAHLLICGTGPQRQRLERFRKLVRIEDRVHFLGARTDLADWLPHVDVFWSGREDNGQPLALLMAMAAGVPSITTRLVGAEQVIQHGQNGFLVPVGDRAGIARLTRKLLNEPADAHALGQRGQQHVAACFSVQLMAEAFLRLYRSLVA